MPYIKKVSIKNFKSIKELYFEPKQKNIFIGRPNTGKSNILEALAITSLHNTQYLKNVARMEDTADLFSYQNIDVSIEITINTHQRVVIRHIVRDTYEYIKEPTLKLQYLQTFLQDEETFARNIDLFEGIKDYKEAKEKFNDILKSVECCKGSIDKFGNINILPAISTGYAVQMCRYKVDINNFLDDGPPLMPPNGINLYGVIYKNKVLRDFVSGIFSKFGFQFSLGRNKKFRIQIEIDNIYVELPYLSISDTLKRFIFYKAIIESNTNSVILLEEPESHIFPEWITHLGEKVAKFGNDNQYFITTHNPYFLEILWDNCELQDLNVFIVYWDNFQTKCKLLQNEEIQKIIEIGEIYFLV